MQLEWLQSVDEYYLDLSDQKSKTNTKDAALCRVPVKWALCFGNEMSSLSPVLRPPIYAPTVPFCDSLSDCLFMTTRTFYPTVSRAGTFACFFSFFFLFCMFTLLSPAFSECLIIKCCHVCARVCFHAALPQQIFAWQLLNPSQVSAAVLNPLSGLAWVINIMKCKHEFGI